MKQPPVIYKGWDLARWQQEAMRLETECGGLRAQVDAAEAEAVGWMMKWHELDGLLEQAGLHVCSLCCPSVWQTGSPQPHCPLCIAITNRDTPTAPAERTAPTGEGDTDG